MSEGFGIEGKAKHAVLNDPHQGGDKERERPGANKGIVDHHQVDHIDHAKHHAHAKAAMAEMGHYNVEYFDGGMRK